MVFARFRQAKVFAATSIAVAITGTGLATPTGAVAAGQAAPAATPALAFSVPLATTKTRIVTQPSSLKISRYGTRTSGSLKVVATGSKLSYRWQYRSGGTWKSISGATKKSYKVKSSKWSNGTRFRVVVRGKAGRMASKTVSVKVLQPSKTPAKDAQRAFGLSGVRQGVDLSAWQYLPTGRINHAKLDRRLGSKGFTILRNGSGSRPIKQTYTDSCTNRTKKSGSTPVIKDCAYATLASRSKAAGLSLGHYWFNGWISSNDNTKKELFSGGFTAKRSARAYVKWLLADGKYTKKSTDPLVLDIEAGSTWVKKSNGKTYTRKLRAWNASEAKSFLLEVKRVLKSKGYKANLYVYMSSNAATKTSGGRYVWKDIAPISRLWVASWGTNNGRIPASQPAVGPWASQGGWSIWQYTSNVHIDGDGVGALDGDIARSSAWTPKS